MTTFPVPFPLDKREVDAIAVAYDELLSYYETVGFEGDLDDEEMPQGKIPWALGKLRTLLDRYAKYETLTTQAAKHGGVVEVEPVRFDYHPDTPPSGPPPEPHVCPTCEQELAEVVVRITGVCPKHGVVPVVCGNPKCWCIEVTHS